jgi:hypothetical protein
MPHEIVRVTNLAAADVVRSHTPHRQSADQNTPRSRAMHNAVGTPHSGQSSTRRAPPAPPPRTSVQHARRRSNTSAASRRRTRRGGCAAPRDYPAHWPTGTGTRSATRPRNLSGPRHAGYRRVTATRSDLCCTSASEDAEDAAVERGKAYKGARVGCVATRATPPTD